MKKYILCMLLFLFVSPAWAVDIEGVQIPDKVKVEGQTLQLNGAGVRTKFFFDIYVGALYLAQPSTQAKTVLAKPSPARVSMNILYSEVDKEKLIKGWLAGFKKNQSKASFEALKERLDKFNAMFSDMQQGDQLYFDFVSNGETHVVIKGQQAGSIAGLDFQQALLAVWLGDKPADSDLKEAMLKGK